MYNIGQSFCNQDESFIPSYEYNNMGTKMTPIGQQQYIHNMGAGKSFIPDRVPGFVEQDKNIMSNCDENNINYENTYDDYNRLNEFNGIEGFDDMGWQSLIRLIFAILIIALIIHIIF